MKHRTFLAFLVALTLLAACSKPDEKAAKYIEHGNLLFTQGDMVRARLEYMNALQAAPTNALARYKLALVDEHEGRLSDALKNFTLAEQQDPALDDARIKVLQYNLASKRYDEAKTRLDILLQKRPDDPMVLSLQGAYFLHQKDLENAEKSLQAALSKDPDFSLTQMILTRLRLEQHRMTEAGDIIDAALAKSPKEIPLHLLRIEIRSRLNDDAGTIEAYRALIQASPENKAFRYDLADTLARNKHIGEAQQVLEETVASFPADLEPAERLAFFIAEHSGLPAAEDHINKTLKSNPDQHAPLFWLADLYMKNDQPDKALHLLETLVGQDSPLDIGLRARNGLARIYFVRHQPALAEKLVAYVLQKKPDNPEALFLRATLEFENGAMERAVGTLRSLLRDRPKNQRALALLTETHVTQGRTDLAIDSLTQMLAIDPTNVDAAVRLAQIRNLQGDVSGALRILTSVIQIHPESPIVWESTARIALGAGELERAEQAIQKLGTLEGQTKTASFLNAALLETSNKLEEALDQYKKIIRDAPDDSLTEHALLALARVSQSLKQPQKAADFLGSLTTDKALVSAIRGQMLLAADNDQEAAAAFDDAIAKKISVPEPYLNRASLYHRTNQHAEALRVLELGETAAPRDPRAALTIAQIHMDQGQLAKAKETYKRLLARMPNVDIAANNLAQILIDNERDDAKALDEARIIAERFIGSDNPFFLDTLGWVYFRQGRLEQSLTIMERAMKLVHQPTPEMHYHYGKLMLALGKDEDARTALEKAMTGTPSFPQRDDAQTILKALLSN